MDIVGGVGNPQPVRHGTLKKTKFSETCAFRNGNVLERQEGGDHDIYIL